MQNFVSLKNLINFISEDLLQYIFKKDNTGNRLSKKICFF
jgi:hypothetical protein